MLQHNVYFYLKPGLSEQERMQFEDGLKSLLTIEELVEGSIGKPAGTAPRPVVDSSYDYALSTVFKDVQQHDVYQEHPVHQKFIENCNVFWQSVKIYDVEVF